MNFAIFEVFLSSHKISSGKTYGVAEWAAIAGGLLAAYRK